MNLLNLTEPHHGGCAAKACAWDLADLLKVLEDSRHESVMGSQITNEDVAAYKLNDIDIILNNVDLITPVSPDPFDFGKIAVAHSLSDIYAKGGEPLFAMNILCFPFSTLGTAVAKIILAGGYNKLQEARVALLGGHTMDSREPKYGLSVVGKSTDGEFISNHNMQIGDKIVLTKPLGTGVIISAMKLSPDLLSADEIAICLANMESLNKDASRIAKLFHVNSATDVTGFGLAGHLAEMTAASNVGAKVFFDKIPLLPGVARLLEARFVSEAAVRNQDYYQIADNLVVFDMAVMTYLHYAIFDPQTSGGLLLSVRSDAAEDLIGSLVNEGVKDATIIGEVTGKPDSGRVIVV